MTRLVAVLAVLCVAGVVGLARPMHLGTHQLAGFLVVGFAVLWLLRKHAEHRRRP